MAVETRSTGWFVPSAGLDQMTLLLSPMMIRRPACPGSSQRAGGARHQMTAGEPLLLLLLVGGALLLRATPAHQPPVAVAQWPVDHLCSEAGHHLVKMTRAEDGRDGGIYSSDSAGQTPSLASIYQVRQSSSYQVAIFGGCKSSLWRRNDKNREQEVCTK